mmetsp:Transcript_24305/g.55398  ORF Transcript_24305/g.55398 Transcript_24305/m.55398 type:complete len:84 (-) Transcript_24305:1093-1344(-)
MYKMVVEKYKETQYVLKGDRNQKSCLLMYQIQLSIEFGAVFPTLQIYGNNEPKKDDSSGYESAKAAVNKIKIMHNPKLSRKKC